MTGISLNMVSLGALAWVAWDAWQSGILQGALPEPAHITPQRIEPGAERVDIGALVNARLFGVEERAPRIVERKEAPPTRLNLKLVGIIAIGQESQGIALIESGRGQQQVVRVGQVIGKTDAILAEVRRDHVLIERGGELEKLAIKRPELESQPVKTPGGGMLSDSGAELENLPVPSVETAAVVEQPNPVVEEPRAAAASEAAPLPTDAEPPPDNPLKPPF